MRQKLRLAWLWVALALLATGVTPLRAFTMSELDNDDQLTPATLLQRFAHFKFKLFDGVQPREVFLATQTGDCDDFATLAADLLSQRGYTTRLVAVFMAGQAHVVCYVKEAAAYLDYNNRDRPSPLVPSDGSLPDIARKVAQTFAAPWTSVAEYLYQNGQAETVRVDFPGN